MSGRKEITSNSNNKNADKGSSDHVDSLRHNKPASSAKIPVMRDIEQGSKETECVEHLRANTTGDSHSPSALAGTKRKPQPTTVASLCHRRNHGSKAPSAEHPFSASHKSSRRVTAEVQAATPQEDGTDPLVPAGCASHSSGCRSVTHAHGHVCAIQAVVALPKLPLGKIYSFLDLHNEDNIMALVDVLVLFRMWNVTPIPTSSWERKR